MKRRDVMIGLAATALMTVPPVQALQFRLSERQAGEGVRAALSQAARDACSACYSTSLMVA